jgi:hypothetical protein
MLIRLRLKERFVSALVGQLMNAPEFLHQLRGRAKHAIGQSSINQDDLLDTRIPKAPPELQQRLAEEITARIGRAQEVAGHLVGIPEHAHLQTAILSKAFAGQL